MRLRLVALAVLVIAIGSAFVLFPWGWTNRPHLRLLALDSNGRFDTLVVIPRSAADTTDVELGDAVAKLPLVLGVSNTGRRIGEASVLRLSIPARFRLLATDGAELPTERTPGNPLVRYEVAMQPEPLVPGRLPTVLPGLDTLWLEPLVPTLYCISLNDSVPDFVSAGTTEARPIASAQIFYSFEGTDITSRQTGVLGVQVDSTLLQRAASPAAPVFPAEMSEAGHPLPEMSGLHRVGSRVANCGDHEQPMELVSHQWDTAEGGRFFVLDFGGVPRKYLFDLNRDSIIELEMWDPDADGEFEGRRPARLPIPPFLMPVKRVRALDARTFAELTPDSLNRLDPYARVRAEPYRMRTRYPDTTAAGERFRRAVAFTPAGPPRPVPLPAWGPQFRYTPPVLAAQPEYKPLPEWGPQYTPGIPARADAPPVVLGRYVRLPPWGPVYSYTRPPRRAPSGREPRLLGVPVEQPRERARPREEPQDPTAGAQREAAPEGVPSDVNNAQPGAQPVGEPANALDLLGQPAQSDQLQQPQLPQPDAQQPSEQPPTPPAVPPDAGAGALPN